MEIIEGKKALRIAKKYQPVFCQGFESELDLITPINLGEFVLPVKPTIYFSAKENTHYYFLLYCVYHYRDWSDWPPPFKSWDEHRHDFEGVLTIINKHTKKLFYAVTVFHHELKFYKADELLVWNTHPNFDIEYGGHGIRGFNSRAIDKNNIEYFNYKLFNINGKKFQSKWDDLKKIFNKTKVNMPDQWNDWRIKRKFGKRTDGLIYTNPNRLFHYAKKCRLI